MKSIQEAVASVQNAFPSIYTKDDVVKLLNSIEIESSKEIKLGFSKEQVLVLVDRIINEVKENADNLDSDCIDKGTAEFSLNYNEIELDSVDFDQREVRDAVVNGLEDVAETFFEEYEEKEEEEEEEEVPEEEVV